MCPELDLELHLFPLVTEGLTTSGFLVLVPTLLRSNVRCDAPRRAIAGKLWRRSASRLGVPTRERGNKSSQAFSSLWVFSFPRSCVVTSAATLRVGP